MCFDTICTANEVRNRPIKSNHFWTNALVKMMNRRIKQQHYKNHDQLCTQLASFMAAYNCSFRLKVLGGLIHYE